MLKLSSSLYPSSNTLSHQSFILLKQVGNKTAAKLHGNPILFTLCRILPTECKMSSFKMQTLGLILLLKSMGVLLLTLLSQVWISSVLQWDSLLPRQPFFLIKEAFFGSSQISTQSWVEFQPWYLIRGLAAVHKLLEFCSCYLWFQHYPLMKLQPCAIRDDVFFYIFGKQNT